MFNSTHTFVGFAVAKTGVEKWAPYATATAVIAANLPDIDSFAGLWGTAAYLDHHRGFTHSLIGVPVLAFLLSAVMYFFSENFWKTYAVALIAMATHPALDYLNPYGLRPFLPFSAKWYYGDAVFIIDPYLDALLLSGVIVGLLKPQTRRVAAGISLVIAVVYIGIRIELHSMATTELRNTLPQTGLVRMKAVLPQMLSLRMWEGVIETDQAIVRGPVVVLRPPVDIDAEAITMTRTPSSKVITRAATASSAAALLRFARFPVTRVEQLPSGYGVTFLDFRFYRETAKTALAAKIVLDESMNVTSEDLSFVHLID